jgi:hypothetical protein
VAILAGLLPECRNTLDAKRLPRLLESLRIERSLWVYCQAVRASFGDRACTRPQEDSQDGGVDRPKAIFASEVNWPGVGSDAMSGKTASPRRGSSHIWISGARHFPAMTNETIVVLVKLLHTAILAWDGSGVWDYRK